MVSWGSFCENFLAFLMVESPELPSTRITSKLLSVCSVRSFRRRGRASSSFKDGMMMENRGDVRFMTSTLYILLLMKERRMNCCG